MIDTVVWFFVLLVLSGFFSSAELATMSLSRMQVDRLVREHRKNAVLLRKLKSDPHKLLTTILIGNNLVNIAAAAIATALAIELLGSIGIGIATGITTFLVLLFGEIIPKSLAVSHASRMALYMAPLLYFLQIVLTPLIVVIDSIASIFRRFFGEPEEDRITEEIVTDVVDESQRQGGLKTREAEMIRSVLDFDDRNVDEIMTPRLDVFSLEMHRPVADVLEEILDKGYSRVPVYDRKMDRMKGVVLVKDILRVRENPKTLLLDIMQPVLFAPETQTLDRLLREFQRHKTPFAIVVDEHGLFIGVVTSEDIVEELVGEIYDESDKEEDLVQEVDKKTLLVAGKAPISFLNEQHHLKIPEADDYDTLGGFITDRLGRMPKEGDKVQSHSIRYIVQSVTRHRVKSVKVKR